MLYLAKQRLLPAPRIEINRAQAVQLRQGLLLSPILLPDPSGCEDYEFGFLNVSRSFTARRINWVCADMPKLWRYNLHYFDYLNDRSRSSDSLAEIVSDWIDKNAIGVEDAWEPYTVSLRIVNWIKWFLDDSFDTIPRQEWLRSLCLQAAWLEKNIEHHLLANHYLKNAKALFFAGAYFAGSDAERWFRKGLKILCEEACEQILADGGHNERSPMYHCIVVEDFLDILNLCLSNPDLVEPREVDMLRQHTCTTLDFLQDILTPDGQIPLFNDAAFGIAPRPDALFDYAQRLIQYRRRATEYGLSICSKPDSGYYVIRDSNDMLIVDCGLIGPDYQPGHAHCDTLSYELFLDKRRIIVDTGVHDYENTAERAYARSTRAHNTVVVDSEEQSEIWGVFRVARRAKPLQSRLKQLDSDRVKFEGAHNGYQRLPGKVTHHRTIEYDRKHGWYITDSLRGGGRHHVESFIHLAPGLSINSAPHGPTIVLEDSAGTGITQIGLPDNLEAEFMMGKYFPEFGVCQPNQVIRLFGEVELPFTTGYRIRGINAAE